MAEAEDFAPFARGRAVREADGTITGTFALRSDLQMRVTAVEVDESGQFVTTTFVPQEDS